MAIKKSRFVPDAPKPTYGPPAPASRGSSATPVYYPDIPQNRGGGRADVVKGPVGLDEDWWNRGNNPYIVSRRARVQIREEGIIDAAVIAEAAANAQAVIRICA